MTAAALGGVETAVRGVERALREGDPTLQYIHRSIYLAPLRDDPCFPEILRRLNVVS
jgi:hypothetical protein